MVVTFENNSARAVHPLDRAFKEIHGRRTHKIGDKEIGWRIVNLGRRPDLLQLTILQDGDLGRKRHRLNLIVRDIDDCCSSLLVEPLDFNAHVDAQLSVKIRERLVEQEHLRLTHERSAHGYALPLTARELARSPS